MVVVVASVKNVNPERHLGDVAGGDVHDRHGQTSTLSTLHVVRVGIVQADTVVVVVSTRSVAEWVADVTRLSRSVRWLSVGSFWRTVDTVEVERWGIVSPVSVRVGTCSGGCQSIDTFPSKSEFIGFVVGAVGGLAQPHAVHDVVVPFTEVVGPVVDRVVVAVPGRRTARTTVVGANFSVADSGV